MFIYGQSSAAANRSVASCLCHDVADEKRETPDGLCGDCVCAKGARTVHFWLVLDFWKLISQSRRSWSTVCDSCATAWLSLEKNGFTRVKLCTASTLQTSRVLNKEIVTHMIGPCGANMLGNSYPRGVVNNVCMCHDVVDEKRERPLLTDSKLGNSYPRGVVNNVCMCHDVVDEKRERP